jgi:hypothetical protein
MILVTGCARSGTSLITRILQAHGCNLGETNRVNVLFENVGVRQNVLKPYLSSIGADPLGQRALPDTDKLEPVDGMREKVLRYIIGDEPKAYKDAKLCLVWPVIDEAFPEAKWVLVRRAKDKIVASCLRERTSEGFGRFMLASDDYAYWCKWVEEHEARFEKMRQKLYLIEVWPDLIIDEPSAFESVTSFLGLKFNLDATTACINRKLWHGHERS